MVLVSVPVSMVTIVTQKHAFGAPTGCLVVGFLDDSASFVGLWCISMTSLDRLVAVSRPILYRKVMKKGRVVACVGVLFLISLATSVPLFITAKNENFCGDSSSENVDWQVFVICYQVLRLLLPLTVTLLSYSGIFLAARNLRYRELARRKVLDEIDTKKVDVSVNRVEDVDEIEDESGIDMIESTSLQSVEDRNLVRSLSASSSIRRSIVFNNNVVVNNGSINNDIDQNIKPDNYSNKTKSRSGNNLSINNIDNTMEFRKSLKFSNAAVFLDTLNNTFFTSNLMEELNIRHEDYFSLSQSEEEGESYETVTEDISMERAPRDDKSSIRALVDTLSPGATTFSNDSSSPEEKCCWCCCCTKKARSLPERLQLKAAVLLGVVAVVIIGSHIPSIIAGISNKAMSGPVGFYFHLHFVVYTVNPVLFGFLNKTLRSKAVEILCHLFNRRDPLPRQKNRTRRPSVQATLKRIGRRISQTPLLRDSKDQSRGIAEQVESWKKSDVSVLSRKSLIRDQMTLRYFETNL